MLILKGLSREIMGRSCLGGLSAVLNGCLNTEYTECTEEERDEISVIVRDDSEWLGRNDPKGFRRTAGRGRI